MEVMRFGRVLMAGAIVFALGSTYRNTIADGSLFTHLPQAIGFTCIGLIVAAALVVPGRVAFVIGWLVSGLAHAVADMWYRRRRLRLGFHER